MAEADKNPGKTSIQAIERMMMLLGALVDHTDPVSPKTPSASTGLHLSTTHRILDDMVAYHFVDRSDPGNYRFNVRLLEFGNLVKARLLVREATLAPMRALHRLTDQTIDLSVRQGDEIVYIEHAYSERSGMQIVHAVGGHAPLHLTLVGKLSLATDELGRVRAYATHTGLSGHTRTSITDLPKLERELSWVRTDGYTHDNEELELGVHCIAVGIYSDSRHLITGLSLLAPTGQLQDSWLDNLEDTTLRTSKGVDYAHENNTMHAK